MITGNSFTELLRRPQGCGVRGYIVVQDSSRGYFHKHKNIQDAEMCCHHRGKIASDQSTGVVAHKSHPALTRDPPWNRIPIAGPILLHRSRRHQNPSLSESSLATRSCPQVGLLVAISTISRRIFFANRGLPPRDFQRQKSWNAL